jgi:hypothetical protein
MRASNASWHSFINTIVATSGRGMQGQILYIFMCMCNVRLSAVRCMHSSSDFRGGKDLSFSQLMLCENDPLDMCGRETYCMFDHFGEVCSVQREHENFHSLSSLTTSFWSTCPIATAQGKVEHKRPRLACAFSWRAHRKRSEHPQTKTGQTLLLIKPQDLQT